MKTNTISDDAIVLSRINYGETDRILNVLSSRHGKLSVIAKGVRAGKSKLAGGIELFAENELVLLKAKSDLLIVTSSRMKHYFGKIAKDIEATTYAYECLKTVNKLVPEGSGEEYYKPLLNLMKTLDKADVPLAQVKIWFGLRVLQNLGSLPNFLTGYDNRKLSIDTEFEYDFDKHCFFDKPNGTYKPDHIKVLRHLSRADRPVEIKNTNNNLFESSEYLVGTILKTHLV